MEEDRSNMTEKMLNLTLEIIYLLTGESFPPLKGENQLTFTVPLLCSRRFMKSNNKKILKVIQKMVGLLMGEEWEYLEGHKDLYKDVMMEDHQTLT
ncbi:gastrula zinc finger protein XlCGF66.1-like isoform X3 [Pyxicephalus adspersus]|uniref:gastrula zinc finger protein XlCGF66.1-like isoform X3 n=1 Tax=Pyxicephalus adspersus TaxID=30357 RepID=UPI003B5A6716